MSTTVQVDNELIRKLIDGVKDKMREIVDDALKRLAFYPNSMVALNELSETVDALTHRIEQLEALVDKIGVHELNKYKESWVIN